MLDQRQRARSSTPAVVGILLVIVVGLVVTGWIRLSKDERRAEATLQAIRKAEDLRGECAKLRGPSEGKSTCYVCEKGLRFTGVEKTATQCPCCDGKGSH